MHLLVWLRRVCCTLLLWGIYWRATVQPGLAHAGAPLAPHDLWQAWNWDPLLLLGLALTSYLYGRGLTALWRKVGVGRSVTWRQVVLFGIGLLTVVIALISPLDALSEAIFSAHMVQHMLLLYVAPLLLVLGAPPMLFLWAMPHPWRRPLMRWWRLGLWSRLWQGVLHPLSIWSIFGIILWVWHAPALYQAALRSRMLHVVEHLCFFGAALLFCWLLVSAHRHLRTRSGAGYGIVLLIVFTTAMHSGLLGALLTFAVTPLYPIYTASVAQWGLTLLADQQLAGVIMWIPVGFFYLGAMLVLVARWLQEMERVHSQAQPTLAPRKL